MNLNRIYNLKDLLPFFPYLIAEKQRVGSSWDTETNTEQFVADLANYIERSDTLFFGDAKDGVLLYFAALINLKSEEPLFWLLFVDKAVRSETKFIIEDIHQELHGLGVRKMYFITSRLESSYERWLKKFGAKKHKIVYLMEE